MSRPVFEILSAFGKLGLTSFGGPVAHMGFFHAEFVQKRKWLTQAEYADLVGLCQFLPGPSSSQVGFALGLQRGGILGGIVAFVAFTFPSAALLVLFALYADTLTGIFGLGMIHGLKIVATAVVAQAVLGMAKSLCNTKTTATIAVAALAFVTLVTGPLGQVGAIVLGALVGALVIKSNEEKTNSTPDPINIAKPAAQVAFAAFVVLLLGLPVLAQTVQSNGIALFDSFYRAGALVFGGGHVVLPLLETEIVGNGLVSKDTFLAGYGMTQAMPGPIFSFAAFLGAASAPMPMAFGNAIVATIAIFLPGFLLVYAIMPYWHQLRSANKARSVLTGANAAVVGLLAGAFYAPIWQSSILSAADFALGAAAFLLLTVWKTPPWIVVLLGALVGSLLGLV
ncbi:chromate efflux transporter [Maritalea sp.]|uniref:chromate efflux transporter n=1 Tax=Maritalea sp. TaxID=2003361 RepID=UPI003EFAADA2